MTPRTVSAVTNAASMRGGYDTLRDTRGPLDSSMGFSQASMRGGGLDSSTGFYQARLPPDPPLGREMTPRAPDLPRLGASVRTSSAKTGFRGSGSQTARAGPVAGTPPTVSGDYLLPGGLSAYAVDRKVKADASIIFGEAQADLPHLNGVTTATSALEQDEARHWMKWGCGGKGPTEMLKRLAEELKVLFHSLEDGTEGKDQWFPDKRTQRIHEQMLHIASKLQRQPPKPPTPPGQAPTNRAPRTPPSVLKEENNRLRSALAEKQAQVDALENTFAAYVPIKHKIKAREDWLVQYALKGRFLTYDVTAAQRTFALWSKVVFKLCVPRKLKNQHAEVVKRELDAALVALCANLWRTRYKDAAARQRMTLTSSRWADKTQQDFWLHKCFDTWATDACRDRFERFIEKATAEKKRLCDKFGEAAMAQLRQRINADAATLQQWGLSVWVQYNQEVLEERRAKAEAEAAEEKLRQQRMAAAERCFHASARRLRSTSWRGWWDVVVYERLQKEKLEAGMSTAMKKFLATETTLKADVTSIWAEFVKAEINARKLAEIELARRLVANARQRAINMLNKNLSQGAAKLQAMSFASWQADLAAVKKMRMKKDSALAAAMRSIATLDKTVLENTFMPWMEVYKKRVARDKRIDQVLKQLGVSGKALQSEILNKWSRAASDLKQERLDEEARRIAELHEAKMAKMRLQAAEKCFHRAAGKLVGTCWTGWRAQVAASKEAERKLQDGMSRAMKAIMSSEIGLKSACLSLWSDVVRGDRLAREKQEAEMARKLIAKAKERAMNMLNKNLARGAEVLQVMSFEGWHTFVKEIKETEKKREAAMKKAMIKIAMGDKAIVAGMIPPWSQVRKKRIAREKRIDQVLKNLGMSGKHLQKEVLLKWHAVARDTKHERLVDEARRFREIMEEEARKMREAAEEQARKKREEVAERLFGKSRRTLLATSWRGWQAEFLAIKEAKKKLDQGMSHAMKAIMASEAGLKTACFGMWTQVVHGDRLAREKREAEMAKQLIARARERAMAMLHKNLASTVAALQQTCMSEWHHFTESVKQMKKKKDGAIAQAIKSLATLDKDVMRNVLIPWITGFKERKARDQRIQQIVGQLGLKLGAFKSEIFLKWARMTGDLKQERLREEALNAWNDKERQRKLAAAERCFWKTAKTLVKVSWGGWCVEVQITKEQQKKLEEGISKAGKAFLATETTLKAEVIQLWAESLRLDKLQREKAENELAKRLLASCRDRAIRMMKKNLAATAATILASSVDEWKDWLYKVKRRRGQMSVAAILVEAHELMLLQFLIGAWTFQTAHAKEQAIAVEENVKITRKTFLELAQGVVMRLHKRMAVRDPFHAWVTRALG